MRPSPASTITAILTLSLGIDADTTLFSVVDAAVFRPLPYRQPDQLVEVLEVQRRGTSGCTRVGPRQFQFVQTFGIQTTTMEGLNLNIWPCLLHSSSL